MPKRKTLQYVWPKEGPKGRGLKGDGHRGFFGQLHNILTGTGPDIFLQREGSKAPIKPEVWGNWDSYHDASCHQKEHATSYNGFKNIGRDKRYDPHTRKYKLWAPEDDFYSVGIGHTGAPWLGNFTYGDYPRFTKEEHAKLSRKIRRREYIYNKDMGKDWDRMGPKRFRPVHDDFWREAHRIGGNKRLGLPINTPAWPFGNVMAQNSWTDLETWMIDNNIYQDNSGLLRRIYGTRGRTR